MKLLSTKAELQILKTVCEGDKNISGKSLALLVADHFFYGPAVEAYRVVTSRMRDTGDLPTWIEVSSDVSIKEASRKILVGYKEAPLKSIDQVKSVTKVLEDYRKLRAVAYLSDYIESALSEKELDIDEIVDSVSEQLVKARTGSTGSARHFRVGRGNNTTQLIKDTLYGKAPPCVKTGFSAFDERNGGFLWGSLVVLGANTGGGKSAGAVSLLKNITRLNAVNTCIVPLEMSEQQTLDRLVAMLAKVPIAKVAQHKLSSGEKQAMKKAYTEFVNELKETGTTYGIHKPDMDASIEELLLTLRPMGYKVILIDYISLLKGVDDDEQWKKLGAIARYAKIFAETTNTIVILLAQVSDDGVIRYARSIAEHANNAWLWTASREQEDISIYDVTQLKARNQSIFGFQLQNENAYGLVSDVDEAAVAAQTQELEDMNDQKD